MSDLTNDFAPSSERLHHLDALRTFCMVFGVFVHGTTLFQPKILTIVPLASDFFRMATFFCVSGFFAAILLTRMSWSALLKKRTLLLLVPFFVVLILLNPATNYLVYVRHNPPMSPGDYFLNGGWHLPGRGPMVWHLHLWFLLSLWSYFLLLPFITLVTDNRLAARALTLLENAPAPLQLTIIAFVIAIAVSTMRVVSSVALDDTLQPTPFGWVVRATLQYLPLFALGMTLYRRPKLLVAFQRVDPLALAIGTAAVLLTMHFEKALGGAFNIVMVAAKFTLVTAIVAALFYICIKLFSRRSDFVRMLTDAMYSVYLLHYFFLYLLALWLAPVIANNYILYAAVTGLALVICLVLHLLVISRSPLLSLLLNGRAPRRAV